MWICIIYNFIYQTTLSKCDSLLDKEKHLLRSYKRTQIYGIILIGDYHFLKKWLKYIYAGAICSPWWYKNIEGEYYLLCWFFYWNTFHYRSLEIIHSIWYNVLRDNEIIINSENILSSI